MIGFSFQKSKKKWFIPSLSSFLEFYFIQKFRISFNDMFDIEPVNFEMCNDAFILPLLHNTYLPWSNFHWFFFSHSQSSLNKHTWLDYLFHRNTQRPRIHIESAKMKLNLKKRWNRNRTKQQNDVKFILFKWFPVLIRENKIKIIEKRGEHTHIHTYTHDKCESCKFLKLIW